MNIGEVKYGFKLKNTKKINDLNVILYEYEHIHSGGHVVYLKADDDNCVFAIGFKTLPEDSTGVCHIIEHSLLCGSKKYPLKEPFVNLLKSSVNTFLNAFTAADWTMYPFASRTKKDFDNILDIYLDAVFNPLSIEDEKPFLQEGWHYELLNENEIPSFKGVVYNEMKGAMSSVTTILSELCNKVMLHDTTYAVNSGGDPDEIPNLTYEEYKNFYKKHYVPENAMAFFYGDLDIEEKLEYLDREYYSKYEKKNLVIKPTKPLPIIKTDVEEEYSIAKEESLNNNTYTRICYSLEDLQNVDDITGLGIVMSALLSKNNSPLAKSIINKGYGQDISYSIDIDTTLPTLSITLSKTNKEKINEFRNYFIKQINKYKSKGLNKDLLLSVINSEEFVDKEFDVGSTPKGLIFGMKMMSNFVQGFDFDWNIGFYNYNYLREKLSTNYFEELLDKYILNSKHFVQVSVIPSHELSDIKEAEMKKRMLKLKNSLNEEEIKTLIKKNYMLLEYQNHVDSEEELKCLPSLELEDVSLKVDTLPSNVYEEDGVSYIEHEFNSNGIGYLKYFFDMNVLSFEELPYVSILSQLFVNMHTKNYTSNELTKEIQTYLGSISFTPNIMPLKENECFPKCVLYVSCLENNISKISSIVNELLFNLSFESKTIELTLKQMLTALRNRMINAGNSFSLSELRSNYSLDGIYNNVLNSSPTFYNFIKKTIKKKDVKEVVVILRRILKKLINKSNLIVSMSGEKHIIAKLKEEIKKVIIPNKNQLIVLKPSKKKFKSKAYVVPARISFNSLAFKIDEKLSLSQGKYIALSHIVNCDYLWSEVRVKGGAYGCSMGVTRSNVLFLTSYRDPNVEQTYNTYKEVGKYLDSFETSDEQFKSLIIGALGDLSSVSSNQMLIDKMDLWYITSYTKEEELKRKQEVISLTKEDLKTFANIFENGLKNASVCSIGSENKIKEYSFDKIETL